MKIVHAPEDEPMREFSFKPELLYSFDSEPLEEVGGAVWSDWNGFLEALSERKGRALRAALWHELRKEKRDLQFSHVVVRPGELAMFWDDDEIARFRALADDPDTDPEVRDGIWAALGKGDEAEASDSSGSDTSSTSSDTDSA